MATESQTVTRRPEALTRVQRGALGGIVAGVVMGLMLQFLIGRMTAIGALYTLGDPSLTIGWVAHILHSALFGAFFAVFDGHRRLGEQVGQPLGAVGSGVGYATLLWAVNVVFIWPVWLSAVSIGDAPSVPNLAVMPLVGHVVYGALLGLGLWMLSR